MARRWNCGPGLNTVTSNVEGYVTTGSPTIVAANANTNRAFKFNGMTSGVAQGINFQHAFSAAEDLYYRFYLYIVAYPTADNQIFQSSTSGTLAQTTPPNLKLSSTGTLKLCNGATVLATSGALALNTLYRIEFRNNGVPASGSRILDARINGTSFGSISNGTHGTGQAFYALGANTAGEAQTVGEWYCSDLAINDASGSVDNSWCGAENLIFGMPSGAGDSNLFTTNVGGTAGVGNNFTRVNENPPDDNTTYNGLASTSTLSADFFTVSPSGVNSTDTIAGVQVGARCRNNTATSNAHLQTCIKKTSGGTIQGSATSIAPNSSTVWATNQSAAPRVFPLNTVVDPDGAAWTPTTVASMQIGYRPDSTSSSPNMLLVTNIWYYIRTIPAVSVALGRHFYDRMIGNA